MECLLPGPDDGAAEEPEAQTLMQPPGDVCWLAVNLPIPTHVLKHMCPIMAPILSIL